MKDILRVSFRAPTRIPEGPIDVTGPFVAWVWAYRFGNGQIFAIGDIGQGTGSCIYIADTSLGVTCFLLGSFTTDQEQVPLTGWVLARVRRDKNKVWHFAFTGQPEFIAHGPPPNQVPNFVKLTFDAYNGFYAVDEEILNVSDRSAFVSDIRIVCGSPSAQEMADFEESLAGYSL